MKEWTKILQQQTGTGKFNRLPKALLPNAAPIDERSLTEMLALVARYADEIVFADLAGKNNESWSAVLGNDSSLFLAKISSYRLDKIEQKLRAVVEALDMINFSVDYQDKVNLHLQQLVELCLKLTFQIDHWYRQTDQLKTLDVKAAVRQLFTQHIQSELGRQIRQLYAYCQSDEGLLKCWQIQAHKSQKLHKDWSIEQTEPQVLFQGDSYGEQFSFAVKEVQLILRKIILSTTNIVQAAPLLLQHFLVKRQNHQPDIGLVITFLKLFQKAQQQLNNITERHLDYYYFERLQLQQHGGKPSRAKIHFQISPLVDRYHLPKHTLLSAGEDEEGRPYHYQTDQDLLISDTKICQLKALHMSQNNMYGIDSSYKLVSNIYNSTIDITEEHALAKEDKLLQHWAMFGEDQLSIAEQQRQMEITPLGIALTSSALVMQNGERQVSIKFYFVPSSTITFENLIKDIANNRTSSFEEVVNRLFNNAFNISLSGLSDWVVVEKYLIVYDLEEKVIQIDFTLSQDIPPIVPYDKENLTGNYISIHPVLRIISITENASLVYSFLKDLELDKVTIDVAVQGHSALTLYNEDGVLDNSGTSMPFSAVPQQHSYFLLGSVELFNKDLDDLSIQLNWSNPPNLEHGFSEYYAAYPEDITNDSFKVSIKALSKYQFTPHNDPEIVSLFESNGTRVAAHTHLTAIDLQKLAIEPDYSLQELPEFSNQTKIGFLRLHLDEPAMAFGQKEFPNLFAKAALTNSQTSFFNWGKKITVIELPKEPYVPILKQVKIDYKASTTLYFTPQDNARNDASKQEFLIQLHPFGKKNIYPGKVIYPSLIPQFTANGYFYIGFKNLLLEEEVSIFFDILSSQEEVKSTHLRTNWSYLSDNQWQPFTEESLLYNTTKHFTQSGIVCLKIPAHQTKGNTILPAHLHWLRIAAYGELKTIGKLQKIVPHVVNVTRVTATDQHVININKNHEPIVELVQPNPAIDAIQQVTPYYGYQKPEDKNDFYLRVSERLRHKNRAITIWDYERLVLMEFPYIKQVKCLGYTNNEKYLSPGAVQVVVIPKLTTATITAKVGFNQLQYIQAYLQAHASYNAKIKVVNPLYEPIVINATIIFKEGRKDNGRYINLLYDAITEFICPWRKRGIVSFNKKIKKNELLLQLEKLPFVQFISGFSMVSVSQNKKDKYQITDTADPNEAAGYLTPSTPWSVFVPAQKHLIQVIDKATFVVAQRTTIDSMRVGTDFVITEEEENPKTMQVEEEEEEDYFSFFN